MSIKDQQFDTLNGLVEDYRKWLEGVDINNYHDENRTDWMYDIANAAIDFVDTRQVPVV